ARPAHPGSRADRACPREDAGALSRDLARGLPGPARDGAEASAGAARNGGGAARRARIDVSTLRVAASPPLARRGFASARARRARPEQESEAVRGTNSAARGARTALTNSDCA